MKFKISELPPKIQEQLPVSIRTYSDEYYLDELPAKYQEIIRNSLKLEIPVTYTKGFDCIPKISKYSDLAITSTVKDTIVQYLKNYFLTVPGQYPFDPNFGCKLKWHLQAKDTQIRKLMITEEINKVISVMTSDLGLPISVLGISISQVPTTMASTYSCEIVIKIPGEENIKLTVDAMEND